jgi:hypothetical protein
MKIKLRQLIKKGKTKDKTKIIRGFEDDTVFFFFFYAKTAHNDTHVV